MKVVKAYRSELLSPQIGRETQFIDSFIDLKLKAAKVLHKCTTSIFCFVDVRS